MAKYFVRKIDTRNFKTLDDYWNCIENSVERYFNSMKEVQEYCGGKLHKERAGWCGFDGTYDYICTKV